MRIFLTGATGYVGSAVLHALLRGGHDVSALIRDPREAERRARLGVRTIKGDLTDPRSYMRTAEECDVSIHAARSTPARESEVDRLAVDGLLEAAIRRTATGRTAAVIYTSSLWVLGNTSGRATEEMAPRPVPHVAWRQDHEQMVLDAGRGRLLRTVVVRPGIVYGGGRGYVADLLKTAANGLVRVVGDGGNHWACVHDRDLADLYVRLATSPEASGIYHANDEADERVSDIVEAVAQHARIRPDVRHVPIGEARAKMGSLAEALALNQIVRSDRARRLGWAPTLRSVARNVPRLFEEFRAEGAAA
jgi:nucleoside-diphosphate-sugar epimerase